MVEVHEKWVYMTNQIALPQFYVFHLTLVFILAICVCIC